VFAYRQSPDKAEGMQTKFMTYPAHAKAISNLGLPLAGGHLAQIAITVTDTVMLGWFSIAALAAGTIAGSYFFTLFILGAGFAFAVMPMVATLDANDDQVGIRRVTRMGLWLSFGYAILVLPLMLWSKPLFLFLGQEPSVASDASRYLLVAGFGMMPALLGMVIKSYLAALGRTQVVFWITIISAISNALANSAFILGNWGAPEMGVVGAALASLVTQFIALIGIVAYAIIVLPEHQLFVRLWRPDWDALTRVFRLGVPIGVTGLSETGLFAASAVMMGWLGTVPLAAHGVAMQLASITFMLHLGVSNAATIRSGNAYGRQDRAHLARGAKVAFVMSLVMALLTTFVFLVWPEPLISMFMQDSEPARVEIIAVGTILLIMAAIFQLVDGAQAIALGLLRGIQDTGVPMVIAALSYWAIGIPCSYVLGFVLGFGGVGVWSGLVIGLTFASVLLSWRFWGKMIKTVG
jgi:MATE family multidrug resistance protein